MNWTPQADAQILLLRCEGMHYCDVADYLGLPRGKVEVRLAYLKKILNYTYPELKPTKTVWDEKQIAVWREWVNTGTTTSERSSIIREISRITRTSYDNIYQLIAKQT